MIALLRKSVRLAAAAVLHYSGFFRLWNFGRRGGRQEVCVLGLHRVLKPEEQARANSLDGMVLTHETFVRLLDYVRRHFRVVSLEEFIRGLPGPDARPACLLTFDDGWRDNFTTALPELKRLGVPATIFLATGFIDGDATFWVERLKAACRDQAKWQEVQRIMAGESGGAGAPNLEAVVERLKRMPAAQRQELLAKLIPEGISAYKGDGMLSWEEVEQMRRAGIDFGGHSETHPLLPYEAADVVAREVQTCKRKIEQRLRVKVSAFAYPNGDWNPMVRQQVAEAGYECAFTTQRGWYHPGEDRYTIRRILLHEGCVVGFSGRFSPAAFNLKLTGWR